MTSVSSQDPKIDTITIKQRALVFLSDIWQNHLDLIQGQEISGAYADTILNTLKSAVEDSSKSVQILGINLLFSLFENFSSEKNKNNFAPVIYKALTFTLIKHFRNIEMRKEILSHFISLFKKLPTIPIKILCEPFLKQI